MLARPAVATLLAVAQRLPQTVLVQPLLTCSRNYSAKPSVDSSQPDSFAVSPGGLLHIVCTHPHTNVHIRNKPGQEESVTLQAESSSTPAQHQNLQDRFQIQQLPGGRIIDVVEHAATSSSSSTTDSQQQKQQQQLAADAAVLSGSIPSRFCGLSVTTAGGSVTVGQIQEADMHLSTAGGDVQVSRCRAVNASISTAAGAAGQQQQVQDAAAPGVRHSGGEIQVGELGASRVSVYSGGGPVSIKRLFGLTVDVLSAGGPVSIGSVYADRAAISTAGTAAAAAAAAMGAGDAAAAGASSVGQRAAAAAAAGSGVSGGRLHIDHIACLKGEARLESGGGAIQVDGLEGNAAVLSSGGNIKVHLHEQAGLVYVDSDGGSVTAWLSPSGPPRGLQVKAAGGVVLDPALKVTGELGPTMLAGVTSGDGIMGSMSTRTSAMVQEAVAAAKSSAAGSPSSTQLSFSGSDGDYSSGGCSGEAARWQQNAWQVAAWSQQNSSQGSAQGSQAAAAAGGASSTGSTDPAAAQLVINAGWGRVELKAMGWMDALKARMEAKQSNREA